MNLVTGLQSRAWPRRTQHRGSKLSRQWTKALHPGSSHSPPCLLSGGLVLTLGHLSPLSHVCEAASPLG